APAHPDVPDALYRAPGFHACGPRSIRIDILGRLAELIRPLLAWRAPPDTASAPPKGSTGDGGFVVTPEMMSILGCSPEELSNVLRALGFRLERKTEPKPVEAANPAPPSDAAATPDAPADETHDDAPAASEAAAPDTSGGKAEAAAAAGAAPESAPPVSEAATA